MLLSGFLLPHANTVAQPEMLNNPHGIELYLSDPWGHCVAITSQNRSDPSHQLEQFKVPGHVMSHQIPVLVAELCSVKRSGLIILQIIRR